jgi:hypothetical protein
MTAMAHGLAEPGVEGLDGVGIRFDITDAFDLGAGSWF